MQATIPRPPAVSCTTSIRPYWKFLQSSALHARRSPRPRWRRLRAHSHRANNQMSFAHPETRSAVRRCTLPAQRRPSQLRQLPPRNKFPVRDCPIRSRPTSYVQLLASGGAPATLELNSSLQTGLPHSCRAALAAVIAEPTIKSATALRSATPIARVQIILQASRARIKNLFFSMISPTLTLFLFAPSRTDSRPHHWPSLPVSTVLSLYFRPVATSSSQS